MLCKKFRPEDPMVWIQEHFLPVSNLIVYIVYVDSADIDGIEMVLEP